MNKIKPEDGYLEQTDRFQRGGIVGDRKRLAEKTYMHIHIARGHRQQGGEGCSRWGD